MATYNAGVVTAYGSAVQGGYTGTYEQFCALMADITNKYTKPSGGIPASDLASAVQTSLGKADSALQSAPVTSVNSKTGAVTLSASDVGAGTYSKPSGGIPSSDMASTVQTSLGKADAAIPAPQSPSSGDFLVYNGSAWAAATLTAWQGGSY